MKKITLSQYYSLQIGWFWPVFKILRFCLGGKAGKLKGRVSDAGLVGCGGYANTHGAAATNGCGESLMKMTLAREAVYHMEQERNAQVSF